MATYISNSEILSRQQCLDDLDDYINQCQEGITSMLDELGWTPDHFIQPRSHGTCKHHMGHKMPNGSLSKHEHMCEVISRGCTKEEAEQIITDLSYAYQESSCVYTETLDIAKLNAVLWNYHVKNNSVFYGYKTMPLTPEQEEQMLSREDRLGLAEFIISKGKEAKKLKELGRDEMLVSENLADLVRKEGEARQLDHVEELAAMRDYRRRRQSYRAKNVHITKKSHTEILREVITNQMEMYAKSLDDQGAVRPDRQRNERDRDMPDMDSYQSQSDRSWGREKERSRKRSSSRDRGERSRDYERINDRQRLIEGQDRKRPHSQDMLKGSEDQYPVDRLDRSASQDRKKRNDRSGNRSRSRSSERHKKHKHKKHKHKHKHKHRRSDVEHGSPYEKSKMTDESDD